MMAKLFSLSIFRFLLCSLLLGGSLPVIAQDDDGEGEQTSPAAVATAPPLLLLQSMPTSEINWLFVDGQQVLSLYKKDLSGEAKGGVIILPGLNKKPFSPEIINALRVTLADNGWHSLAVMMPGAGDEATEMPKPTPATNTNAEEAFASDEEATAAVEAEATIEMANEASLSANSPAPPTLSSTEEHAQNIIAAAVQYFNNDDIFTLVLIGEGASALRAAHYIANMPAVDQTNDDFKQISAFGMINARNQIDGSQLDLVKELPQLDLPIIDLYSGLDYRDTREANIRKKISRRFENGQYTQIKLPASNTNWQGGDDWLTKRMRGWLDRRAADFEVFEADVK